MYVPSKYEQVWVWLTMRITVWTIPEAFAYSTKIIRTGYTTFLNMFKNFVLTCRSYTHKKNTVRIDSHCHCHCQNGLEWWGMIPRTNSNDQFVQVRQYIRHCETRTLQGNSLTIKTMWSADPGQLVKNVIPFIRNSWVRCSIAESQDMVDSIGPLGNAVSHWIQMQEYTVKFSKTSQKMIDSKKWNFPGYSSLIESNRSFWILLDIEA